MYSIELRANEIYFFYTLVEAIHDPVLLNRYRSVISRAESIKTDRYVFQKDRHNCLVTRALLRFALSTCTGVAPATFEFLENRYGKPSLKPRLVDRPVQFNLSHSSGMTACALTLAGDIGVDIESNHRKIELDLAERYFAKSESAYLRQCPADQKQAVFFDFWTLKESYIKAVGKGLSIDLDQFAFELDPQPRIIFDKSLEGDPDHWKFFRFSPADHYKAAIAIHSPANPDNVKLRIYKCVPFLEIQPQATLVSCRMIGLRPATADDVRLLRHWDAQPHVIASNPNDDWRWEVEFSRSPDWREQLIAQLDGRAIGYVQIIDPAREESHYWGNTPAGLRAIDIWIGEAADLGKGFGTKIMDLALERCFCDARVTAVLVDPLAGNTRSHRFYERQGFRFVESRRFGIDDCYVYRLERSDWSQARMG